jgi:hypothetical protein
MAIYPSPGRPRLADDVNQSESLFQDANAGDHVAALHQGPSAVLRLERGRVRPRQGPAYDGLRILERVPATIEGHTGYVIVPSHPRERKPEAREAIGCYFATEHRRS